MPRNKDQIDFNDLHVLEGLPAVKAQLEAALNLGVASNDDMPPIFDAPPMSEMPDYMQESLDAEYELDPPAPQAVKVPDLAGMLLRYALTTPHSKIWDSEDKSLITQASLKSFVSNELFKQWMDHKDKNIYTEESVIQADIKKGLAIALNRYSLAMPRARIWDSHSKIFLAQPAFKSSVGKEIFDAWLRHENRREVQESDVAEIAKSKRQEGQEGLQEVLQRYIYLESSKSVWDNDKESEVPIDALRYSIASCFDDWIKHPNRKQIPRENLVFDPSQQVSEGYINRFKGLPLVPEGNKEKCKDILKLLFLLSNEDEEIFFWILRWLALPLQNVGTKMDTAILMHSPVHGSGKSLFFEGICSKLYGHYAKTYGQTQLESNYNDWLSETLFGVFEEVLSRSQKFSHTGKIKQMITGDKFYVEKKFLSGWEESNYMNSVFLSNEVQPLPIEPSDRRFLVVWPNDTLNEEMQKKIGDEMANGGVEAFYHFLLHDVDCKGFDRRTKPPITDAKERLIEFGRPAWEVFFDEWKSNELQVPFIPIRLDQLFKFYVRWCNECREHALGRNKFSGFISTKIKRRRDIDYDNGKCRGKGTIFFPVDCPHDQVQCEWVANSIVEVEKRMPETE